MRGVSCEFTQEVSKTHFVVEIPTDQRYTPYQLSSVHQKDVAPLNEINKSKGMWSESEENHGNVRNASFIRY